MANKLGPTATYGYRGGARPALGMEAHSRYEGTNGIFLAIIAAGVIVKHPHGGRLLRRELPSHL